MNLVSKLTLLGGLLLAAPVFACRLAYCAQLLAPADQLTLPANAQAVVASGKSREHFDHSLGQTVVWNPWIRRVNADGGVRLLTQAPAELQPSGDFGAATLFLLDQLTPGERFRLESSGDCDSSSDPSAEVLIVDAAPLPEHLGTPVSPPSVRVEPPPGAGVDCGPSDPVTNREIFLDFDESVRPWLSVAKINLEVNGLPRSTDYGRLARGHDGGSRVFVQRLTRTCVAPFTEEPESNVETWPIRLELEIPGMTERPAAVDFSVEMDCRPSCASAGVTPWLLGVLLLGGKRRRRRVRPGQ